jgi:site-specific DNA-methyltransferase (adenine-specific)
MNKDGGGIHPTEKPVALYKWTLRQYAKAGDLILDTHVGSASSLIACTELGYDYVGFEIDKEYYEMAKSRLGRATRKYELFEAV